MFRKSIMLALAATVSLGAFALSSSDASAFGRSFGGGGVHFGGGGMRLGGGALHLGGGLRYGGLHSNPHFITGIKINPGFNHHVHFWPRWWWWRHAWRRPYWIAPVVVGGGVATAATYASTPAPATSTCTCLTKQYTPQGAVVFKDVCTNEMAMNPPANASPAADMGPQMPPQSYQQGYLQPQGQ